MARIPRDLKWLTYLFPTVVMGVLFEVLVLYNRRDRPHEFLFIAFAAGTITAITCWYLMARSALMLEDITKAPILKLSPNIKKIIAGEANHVIPYARVEGQVKAVHQPIRSMYVDGITAVMQRVECREYTSTWDKQKKIWVDTDRVTHKASETVPFILTNGESSIRVNDPEKASGLELTTLYDKFHPTSNWLFKRMTRWFSGGTKTKGHQKVELILEEGKTLTGVGELRILGNGGVSLHPPSNGRVYILTKSFTNDNFTNELKASITKWKEFGRYSIVSTMALAFWIMDLTVLLVCGLAVLTLASVYVWFKHQWQINTNMRNAFNWRVQAIENHLSDDESSEKDDTNVCVVCMSEPRDYVLVDCGHVCVCRGCAQELNPHECPICRKRILQVMPIYHA
ncbi:mitochondrial ubiquitin ligase activator of NFKB 1-like [Amphiura filiformis]|uniref:mitochondrial ubiquitin ligase activator of NFKB 1-like n=1 Tax=Amphiura filiformis TaxID=82378 RepID=UPI003B213E76